MNAPATNGWTPTALVTGGSAGIGLATAVELVGRGWEVAIVGRRPERLERAIETIAARTGADAAAFAADLSEPGEARRVVRETVDEFGRLDALVNNAGVAPLRPIAETDDDTITQTFALNSAAPTAAISEAWPTFAAQRSGVVVNVSSLAARDPFPGFLAYAASKAAVNLLAKSVAIEGETVGVKGFAVAPGAVETEMLRGLFDRETLPESQTAEPEAIARVIAACCCGERDADNGGVVWLGGDGP